MLFLNKITKLEWEISNQEHIKRLLRDLDYDVIEKVKVEKVKVKDKKAEKEDKKVEVEKED